MSNLKLNLGFHFSVGYILLFCFLLIIVSLLDRRQFHNKFEEQLYFAVHQVKENENKTNQNSISQSLSPNNSNLHLNYPHKPGVVQPTTNIDKKKTNEMLNYQEEELASCFSDGITLAGSAPKHHIKMNSFFDSKEVKQKFSSDPDSEET